MFDECDQSSIEKEIYILTIMTKELLSGDVCIDAKYRPTNFYGDNQQYDVEANEDILIVLGTEETSKILKVPMAVHDNIGKRHHLEQLINGDFEPIVSRLSMLLLRDCERDDIARYTGEGSMTYGCLSAALGIYNAIGGLYDAVIAKKVNPVDLCLHGDRAIISSSSNRSMRATGRGNLELFIKLGGTPALEKIIKSNPAAFSEFN